MQPLSGSLRVPQVILKLLVQPTFRTGVECDGETNSHLGADARTPVQDAGKSLTTDSKRSRGFRDTQIQRLQAQSFEYLARMWWIVHLHNPSVIILVVNVSYIFPGTRERDTPITAHLDGPRPLSLAPKLVEIQTRQVHVLGVRCHVQTAEYQSETVGMFTLNSRLGAGGEEAFESFVPESGDRHRI